MRNKKEILLLLLLMSCLAVQMGCDQGGEEKVTAEEKGSKQQEAMVIGVSESVEDFYRAAVAKF